MIPFFQTLFESKYKKKYLFELQIKNLSYFSYHTLFWDKKNMKIISSQTKNTKIYVPFFLSTSFYT